MDGSEQSLKTDGSEQSLNTDASKAKKARANAKRMLTISLNKLTSAVNQESDVDIIQDRLKQAADQMDNVTEVYHQYLDAAYPDAEEISAEDEEWMNKITQNYDTIEAMAYKKMKETIKSNDTSKSNVRSEDAVQEQALQRQCKYEEMLLVTAIDNFSNCLLDKTAPTEGVRNIQKDTKERLDMYCNVCRDFSIKCNEEAADEIMERVKVYVSKFNEINMQAERYVGSKSNEPKSKPDDKSSLFKVEKMKMPQFDGDIRTFPRFISDVEKFILPKIEHMESGSYILRSCLSGPALEAVRSIDDNLEQMIERLKDKFGEPSKLADVIMNDIKQVRAVSEGDDKAFVKFVTLIENSFNDLARIEMDQEISNSSIVSLIEERLPKSIKNQWCLVMVDEEIAVDKRNKFPELIKFLIKQKRAVEYGTSDLRSSIPSQRSQGAAGSHTQRLGTTNHGQSSSSTTQREVCWIHQGEKNKHPTWQCEVFQVMSPSERLELTLKNKACVRCLLMKCPGSTDQSKCWSKFKCRINGCGKEHNKWLHMPEDGETSTSKPAGTSNHVNMESEDISVNSAAFLPLQSL